MQKQQSDKNELDPRIQKLIVAFIILGFLGAAGVFIHLAQLSSWDFRNNLWGPAHLLTQGRAPYNILQLFEGSNAVWMPTIVGIGTPLGYLSEVTATNLWFVINLAANFLLILLMLPEEKPIPLWIALAMICAYLYVPFASLLTFGQISLITTVCVLLAVITLHHLPWLSALLMVCASAKPQLLILAAPAMLILYYRQSGRNALLRYVGYGILFTLLSTLPLWLAYPDWITSLIEAMGRNQSWALPSLLFTFQSTLGGLPGLLLWALLAIPAALFALRFCWQHYDKPLLAISIVLAITAWITPYVWSWDFMLIMPLFLWLFFRLERHLLRGLMGIGYTLIWSASVYVRVVIGIDDVLMWWLPSAMLLLIAGMWVVAARMPSKTPEAPSHDE